jgi:NADH dehydrogenase
MAASILVLGGGFAGLAAANALAHRARKGGRCSVRLVDRCGHSTFTPLLPEVVSGRVRPQRVLYGLEQHCRRLGVEFIRAEVTAVSPGEGVVQTDRGALSADFVIVCLGCENDYYGNGQMKRRAPGLKSLEDALRVRSEVAMLARHVRGAGGNRPVGHVVVAGGGYAGLEAASNVARLLERMVGRAYVSLRALCPIVVVEKAEQVLSGCPDAVRDWVLGQVRAQGIDVRTNVVVGGFEGEKGVRLSDGSVLGNAFVIWCAGVKPGAACAPLSAGGSRGKRLTVDAHLRVEGASKVFAAGDVAAAVPPGEAAPLRMAVQFSLAGGRCAALNALRALDGRGLADFSPADLGYVVPLAHAQGAGVVLGHGVYGRIPSVLHYAMCLFRTWGGENRLQVLMDLLGQGGAQ